MRSLVRKELITCFKQEFESRFPQFKRLESVSQILIWEWRQARNLAFFVALQPLSRYDQFTLEVAWSEDGEFPWSRIGKTKIEGSQGRERLPHLWSTTSKEPVWDVAPEESAAIQGDLEARGRGQSPSFAPPPPEEQVLARVPPLVKDAVEKLVQYGLPLFRRVAEHRGLSWPSESKVVV